MTTTSLVTGGCGFIGSHLADALIARGDRVVILDDLSTGRRANAPSEATLIVGDVADRETVRAAMSGVDRCFHLAAVASVQRSTEAWLETHRINLGGTINVLEAAAGRNLPVVYASSSAVYGDAPTLPMHEDMPLRPLSPYGADKAGSELHAFAAFATRGVSSTGLRFFNVFGPRQDPHSPYAGVISIFAEALRDGRPLTVFGDGLQSRDFIFVADIVAALIAAMEGQDRSARVFNVCRGVGTSLLDLIAAMERATGRTAEVRHAASRPGEVRHSVGDGRRLREALGVVPAVSLEDGLRAYLNWLDATRAQTPANDAS